MSELLAGAFEVDITPPLDVPLGSGFSPPQVEGVADPLRARALVLVGGEEAVALTNADILAVDPALCGHVRRLVHAQTGIPPQNVLVSATHTHSCGGRLQPSRGNGDPALVEIIARQIAGAVSAARRRLRPAALSVGAVRVPGITRNRRDPDAPVDDVLRVLRVDSDQGLVAVLTTFACHPVLVLRDRPVLSADFPGMMAGIMKVTLGADVVVLPANGACGDVNPVVLSSDGLDSARWIAQQLAGEAIALLARLEAAGRTLRTENTRWGLALTVDALGGARLTTPVVRARTVSVRLPYKTFRPADDLAAEADAAAGALIAAGVDRAIVARWQEGRTVPVESEHGLTAEDRAARRHLASQVLQRRSEAWSARVAAHQGITAAASRDLELQGFAFGPDVALVATPFELFSGVGLDLQAANPFRHLMTLSYSNDLGGYLMPDEELERGGFEPGITFYGKGAAAAVREGCLELLRTLASAVRAAP
ncbi:MAG: hypothetical protein QN178_09805 [Armatimonadota bacterium]|nr:hypothetical protein [Armatimonadota bacterium]